MKKEIWREEEKITSEHEAHSSLAEAGSDWGWGMKAPESRC